MPVPSGGAARGGAGGDAVTAPVFLADGADLSGDVIVLAGPEGRHAATVRRIRPGSAPT